MSLKQHPITQFLIYFFTFLFVLLFLKFTIFFVERVYIVFNMFAVFNTKIVSDGFLGEYILRQDLHIFSFVCLGFILV